jgi:hypothetical protein
MEDTPDKVSAESLGAVGRLVELGLLTGAFVDLRSPAEEPQEPPGERDGELNESSANENVSGTTPLIVLVAALVFVGLALATYRRSTSSDKP